MVNSNIASDASFTVRRGGVVNGQAFAALLL
jgi:hypothetical protein